MPNDKKGDQTEEDGESKGITHLRARAVDSSKLQSSKIEQCTFSFPTKTNPACRRTIF
jgi:hypothetical protein